MSNPTMRHCWLLCPWGPCHDDHRSLSAPIKDRLSGMTEYSISNGLPELCGYYIGSWYTFVIESHNSSLLDFFWVCLYCTCLMISPFLAPLGKFWHLTQICFFHHSLLPMPYPNISVSGLSFGERIFPVLCPFWWYSLFLLLHGSNPEKYCH